MADMHVERPVVRLVFPLQHSCGQFLARHHAPHRPHQEFENINFHRGKREWLPVVPSHAGLHVELERARDERLHPAALGFFGAPPDRPHARQQFLRTERLGKVIVCAGVEPRHSILLLCFGG